IKDHVLLPQANLLEEVNAEFTKLLTEEKLRNIVALIPDAWLHWEGTKETPESIREVYLQFLLIRLKHSTIFTKEAQNAREVLI
ncbi:MAG TPA: aminotransferase class I and II, partial [Bacteroidia bacterium]|nr:aminotransferase class I and II [Bacteroidia bacterium]